MHTTAATPITILHAMDDDEEVIIDWILAQVGSSADDE